MEFDTLAPEITSALIYSGPGAGSLVEASGAWQRLGIDLEHSATSYAALLSALIDGWRGSAALAMIEAAQPYLTWLRTTAQQCQQLAASVQAAAGAFSSAHSSMIPPFQVIANRTRLAQLLASNRFGINLPAIAETDAQYQDMWVNNSAAMNRYAVASARAVAVPQFSSPPQIVSPTGQAAQAGVVPAAATSASSSVASLLSPITSLGDIVNNGWFQLANQWGNQFISSGFPINMLSLFAFATQAEAQQVVEGEIGRGLSAGAAAAASSETRLMTAIGAVGRAAPAASVGVGVSLGKLTAPPAVVGLLPASQAPVRLVSAVSPSGDTGLPGIPMMVPPPLSSFGSGWRKRQKQEEVEYGVQLPGNVMHRPPSGG